MKCEQTLISNWYNAYYITAFGQSKKFEGIPHSFKDTLAAESTK